MSTTRFYRRGAVLAGALNNTSCLGAMDRKHTAFMKVADMNCTSRPMSSAAMFDVKSL